MIILKPVLILSSLILSISNVNSPMFLVPEGKFIMGADARDGILGFEVTPYEMPRHVVYLEPFFIDKYEVSNRQYKKFIEKTGRSAPKNLTHVRDTYNWKNKKYPIGTDDFPVSLVDWEDADAYCHWKKKRLPNEKEWEKAARGTDGRKFPWGNVFDILKANTRELDIKTLIPVNSFESGVSPYGVYNMSGNVSEWTSDIIKLYPGSKIDIKEGYSEQKIFRGGGFTNYTRPYGRVTYRGTANSDYRHRSLGFRCASNNLISVRE